MYCVAMQQSSPEANDNAAIFAVAIGARAVIEATYNGVTVELHPHQLVERHDVLYLRAVNPRKSRGADDVAALGLFHLAGLKDAKILGRSFQPLLPDSIAPARSTDRVIETI